MILAQSLNIFVQTMKESLIHSHWCCLYLIVFLYAVPSEMSWVYVTPRSTSPIVIRVNPILILITIIRKKRWIILIWNHCKLRKIFPYFMNIPWVTIAGDNTHRIHRLDLRRGYLQIIQYIWLRYWAEYILIRWTIYISDVCCLNLKTCLQ